MISGQSIPGGEATGANTAQNHTQVTKTSLESRKPYAPPILVQLTLNETGGGKYPSITEFLTLSGS